MLQKKHRLMVSYATKEHRLKAYATKETQAKSLCYKRAHCVSPDSKTYNYSETSIDSGVNEV